MLSFMQEENDKKANQNSKDEQGSQNESNVNDVVNDEEYLVPASHGENAKRSTIMLAILFSVGALGLWVMIKKCAPDSASAGVSNEEVQIESAIAQLTGVREEMYNRMDDIVDKFYQFSDVEQVDVAELKKNPFRHELNLVDFEGSIEDQDDVGRQTLLREEIERKALQLQLWSVMDSEDGGCCMINDKILYVGDSVEDFEVTKIEGDSVELVSEGVQVTLKIEE